MSDEEFDLIDELYFVQNYDFIKETLGWEDEQLLATLNSLYQHGMIKCMTTPDIERFDVVDVFSEGKNLFYLATKKGLMAHNSL